jgi:BCD family chlorophyll transporter-like MFS transporter
MFDYRNFALGRIARFAPRFLPFADVASETVPLGRLLRLSLFQVTVGMALVLLVGTLNRVMIVELNVPAFLVSVMLALPLVFAPFRTLIGHRSDTHVSAFGVRRVPFIIRGSMLQFGGFAVMPFALLVLAGFGESVDAPLWLGHGSAALAFLMVGAGVHIVQTAGLALACDLVPEQDQPKVVGLMYVMLLVGMIAAAFVFGALLANYTPGRLIQVIQGAAVVTVLLNGIALWKQEPRNRTRAAAPPDRTSFAEAWSALARGQGMILLLIVIGFGTAGFGMADVLLEPYGGQILGMTVGQTTRLTAMLAGGTLVGFTVAWKVIGAGANPVGIALGGLALGIPAFAAIIAAALHPLPGLFGGGIVLAGLGAGLFGHGTLTATMRAAPRDRIGLALGAWGAVQATSAGLAVAVGGAIRDVIAAMPETIAEDPARPYIDVFALEIGLLALALLIGLALWRRGLDHGRHSPTSPDPAALSDRGANA